MGYWFTSDEHYGHVSKRGGVIKYCNRPFQDIDEMDAEFIRRHNSVVGKDDVTIHAGDFCWCNNKRDAFKKYVSKLNGNHVLLEGSHDHWLPASAHEIWAKTIRGQYVVVCHYAMRTWGRSHYNSWQLHGHSHGRLAPIGKQHDVGVDNNNFYPVSFDVIKEIMSKRPDNPNYIGES